MKRKILSTIVPSILPFLLSAQIKIKKLDEVENGVQEAGDSLQKMAMYLVGAVLAIAVLYCVYAVSTNHPKAKEYVLSVIAAIVIYLLALNFVF